jgi:hypothetical protein
LKPILLERPRVWGRFHTQQLSFSTRLETGKSLKHAFEDDASQHKPQVKVLHRSYAVLLDLQPAANSPATYSVLLGPRLLFACECCTQFRRHFNHFIHFQVGLERMVWYVEYLGLEPTPTLPVLVVARHFQVGAADVLRTVPCAQYCDKMRGGRKDAHPTLLVPRAGWH